MEKESATLVKAKSSMIHIWLDPQVLENLENQSLHCMATVPQEQERLEDKHGTLRAGKIGKHKHASCACYQAGSPRSQQEEEEDEDASQQAGKLAFPTKGRSSFFKHASTASYQGKPEYASHDEQEEEVDASTALHQGKPEYASHDNGAERAGKLGKGKHGTLRAEKIGKDKHASLALCQDGSTRLQKEEKDEYALQQAGSQACQKKTSLPCSRLAPKHLPQPIQL